MRRATGTAIVLAVPVALFAAVAGTALHRQTVTAAGTDVAWGLAAALGLLGSIQLLLGAWSGSLVPTAVAGLVCYAAVGFLATSAPGKMLLLGDVAGNLWLYGIAGVTVAMLLWCRRYRKVAPAHPRAD